MDALQIVTKVIEGRKQWGEMYGLGEFTSSQILNALVEMHEKGLVATEDEADKLTKVKRQLTASKAREAKLKKQIKSLKYQVDQMATSRKEAGVD